MNHLHGALGITREGVIYQHIGLPHPPGLLPGIPKYITCSNGLWGRGSVRFCRYLREYGPHGLESAIKSTGIKTTYDPQYNAEMPYVEVTRLLKLVDPVKALGDILVKPENILHCKLIDLYGAMSRHVDKSNGEMGVTGSIAAGIENVDISDIDLIVYTLNPIEVLNGFTNETKPRNLAKRWLGGVRVHPEVWIGWRRRTFNGASVSITLAPPAPSAHCKPLKNYWSINPINDTVVKVINIEPGIQESLLYPPCTRYEGGGYIVSYEYNLAWLLYKGGTFKVKAGRSGEDLYLGIRGYETWIKAL
ncbi:MAG: hypothetical protein GSR85_10610 [Desulfurococcales archaeon]|nr:hypothetical protein [Desulfurococcales archaeon]